MSHVIIFTSTFTYTSICFCDKCTTPGQLIPKTSQQVEGTPPAAAVQSLQNGSFVLASASPGDTASLHVHNADALNIYSIILVLVLSLHKSLDNIHIHVYNYLCTMYVSTCTACL